MSQRLQDVLGAAGWDAPRVGTCRGLPRVGVDAGAPRSDERGAVLVVGWSGQTVTSLKVPDACQRSIGRGACRAQGSFDALIRLFVEKSLQEHFATRLLVEK